MKKNTIQKLSTIAIVLTFALILFSCGGEPKEIPTEELVKEGTLEQLKARKDKLQNEVDDLNKQIILLDEKLVELNPKKSSDILVTEIKDTVYEHYVALQASIETKQDVNITPEYSGVMRLHVAEGQYVPAGATLATIDDGGLKDQLNQAQINVTQIRAQVQQAQIQSDLAKVTFQKQSNLWNQKIGSEIQYLQAKTNYETSLKQVQVVREQVKAAEKGVSSVREQLQKTRLTAPFSGVVETVIAQSGQVVAPGVPILRLVSTDGLKAVANVPEKYLPKIKRGTNAIVKIPSIQSQFDGKVSLVGASINPNNRTFTVEIPVASSNGLVKPNQNAEIQLNDYTNDKAIVIDESLIKQDAKGEYVFVVINVKNKVGVAQKKYIQKGVSTNGKIEILTGLKTGDFLISEAPSRLQEGDEVNLFN